MHQTPHPADVLDFWFLPAQTEGHSQPRMAWFRKDSAFDEEIRERFLPAVEMALAGELAQWAATPPGALALLILLDQFPRNLFRSSAQAFVGKAIWPSRVAASEGEKKARAMLRRL